MVDTTTPQTGAPPAAIPGATTCEAENRIQKRLEAEFPFLAGQFTIQRARRMWVKVPMEQLHPVLVFAKEQMSFGMLCAITGTDEGDAIGLLYHMAEDGGIVLTLVTQAPKDGPGPSTVTPYFPTAELGEREIIDLLGARIQNMPAGPRYPLTDGWPEGQHPLRKDWKPAGAGAAAAEAKGKETSSR
jgi:membrane-bound hydrogenase subunit beta